MVHQVVQELAEVQEQTEQVVLQELQVQAEQMVLVVLQELVDYLE